MTARLSAEEIARLDVWIEQQRKQLGFDLSCPAALRAFMTMGLK
jgi:hypothetical protein